jgi:hypothetical protein
MGAGKKRGRRQASSVGNCVPNAATSERCNDTQPHQRFSHHRLVNHPLPCSLLHPFFRLIPLP